MIGVRMIALHIWISGGALVIGILQIANKDYYWGAFNLTMSVVNLYYGVSGEVDGSAS
jgi:hypothetical protein